MPYDPKKAATYNKLIKDGVPEDSALAQSGIGDGDFADYAIGMNGEMGSLIIGTGSRPGVINVTGRAGPSQVDYDQTADGQPAQQPSIKPITYTTTSTETVSGGGSTTVTSGFSQPNARSQAVEPAITAKQAEIDQFIKDNPSDFARKRQGLPPLSADEKQQRQEQLDRLTAERSALTTEQQNLETPVAPTTTTVPNTTTTTQTVTTATVSTNQEVDPELDQKLSQENEVQLEATGSAANAATTREAGPVAQPQTTVDEFGQVVAVDAPEPVEDPYEAERLRAEQSLSEPAPTLTAEDVGEEDPFEAERLEREQELNRQELAETLTEPEPVSVDDDPAVKALDEQSRADAETLYNEFDPEDAQAAAENAAKETAINQATLQARYKQPSNADWRVRISLSAGATYLYNVPPAEQGILAPLAKTDGVVFPYTPSIETNYVANYEKYDLVHSNYRGAFYKNSAVNDISVRGVFTAQDTNEAAYMLAVIHFFRSVTKMFYGKDSQRGAPPPLVYLTGFGDFQFAGHPCVVTNFSYSLPSDVDYIRANNPNNYGTDLLNRRAAALSSPSAFSGQNARQAILNAVGIPFGATPQKPVAGPITNSVTNTARATYVPTKIEINVTLLPMQTRDQISKQFSLKEFANGKLIQGGFW